MTKALKTKVIFSGCTSKHKVMALNHRFVQGLLYSQTYILK